MKLLVLNTQKDTAGRASAGSVLFGSRRHGKTVGFTLIEMLIVVAIVAILAAIAYPSYTNYITRTRRASAAACTSQVANYMERFYTTNLRYDQTADAVPVPNGDPNLECEGANETGQYYTYGGFDTAGGVTTSTYLISATPTGATHDAECATLTLDQAGTRNIVGGTGTAAKCWGR